MADYKKIIDQFRLIDWRGEIFENIKNREVKLY